MERTELIEKINKIGIKQTFIANKLGISVSYLNHYLKGRRNLPKEHIIRLNNFIEKVENIEL